ncbi:MAG: glutathione S-transferase N-terminal domain-containing protein, partial [Pseudomonadota bacterium]
MDLKLYTYWRSSAAYRVRIALNLKGVSFESAAINIKPGEDEQTGQDYAALNPQMRVPSLELPGGQVVGQSMAIIEWVEETYPDPPLLPADPIERARCRAFADIIACDIHPLNNLSVLADLKTRFGAG